MAMFGVATMCVLICLLSGFSGFGGRYYISCVVVMFGVVIRCNIVLVCVSMILSALALAIVSNVMFGGMVGCVLYESSLV